MTQVKVDEVLSFCGSIRDITVRCTPEYHTMRHKATEVPAHDTVPCSAFTVVKLT